MALISIRCTRYVSSPNSRTDAADPLLPVADFAANGRTTLELDHLTFARATKKFSNGDSGRSRVVTIGRQRIRVERLHPKATNWRLPTLTRLSRARIRALAV